MKSYFNFSIFSMYCRYSNSHEDVRFSFAFLGTVSVTSPHTIVGGDTGDQEVAILSRTRRGLNSVLGRDFAATFTDTTKLAEKSELWRIFILFLEERSFIHNTKDSKGTNLSIRPRNSFIQAQTCHQLQRSWCQLAILQGHAANLICSWSDGVALKET